MGWRRDMRKRRKELKLKKKELYLTNEDFRDKVDAKRKRVFSTILQAGGAITNMIPGGQGISAAISNSRTRNETGVSADFAGREQRLKIQESYTKAKPKHNGTDGKDNKTILVAIGVAAALFLAKGR